MLPRGSVLRVGLTTGRTSDWSRSAAFPAPRLRFTLICPARHYGLFDILKKNEEALLREHNEITQKNTATPKTPIADKIQTPPPKFNYPWNKKAGRGAHQPHETAPHVGNLQSSGDSASPTSTTANENAKPPQKIEQFNLPWSSKKPAADRFAPKEATGGSGSVPPPSPPVVASSMDDHGDPLVQSEVRMSSLERGPGRFPYRILGDESQVVQVDLDPNQVVRAEVGSVISLDPGVEMETGTGGGVGKGITRMLTGESFFITDFRNTTNAVAKLVFGASYPCKVLPLTLSDHDGTLICQKGAFLCGDPEVQINMFFTQKLTAGFFGGEGFILQKLDGQGTVLLKGGGASIVKELAAGEILTVSTGTIIAFEQSVHYDVQFVKGGAKNVLFGGQGLFLLKLTGPGTVWLQGLPFDRVVGTVVSNLR